MELEKRKRVVMLLRKDFRYPHLDPRVYKEAQSLVRSGYDVSVVCSGHRGKDAPKYEQYEGINVFRVFQAIPSYNFPLILRLPAYGKFVFKSIKKSLKLNPDVIHCHDLDTLAIGVALKLVTRKPLIFDAHEDFPAMYESMSESLSSSRLKRLLRIAMARILRLYEKVLIKFTNQVIAGELLYTEAMKKHYGISPAVILSFPNLEYFNPSVDPSPIMEKYGLSGKVVISHIGGMGRSRALYEELEALSYLKNGSLIFFLIGRATEETQAEIKEAVKRFKVEDRVILLLDGVRFEDIPKYYKASDITMALLYPNPSYVTSVPSKLYESLAVGVPVIAADLPYIRKIVETYEVGLCANSQDARDIAKKLEVLISDPQMRKRFGQNGLEVAKEEFNWSHSEEKLLEIYHALLSP